MPLLIWSLVVSKVEIPCKITCCSGNPLEPQLRSVIWKLSHGGEQNSGIVIMLRIGQSAWLQPKDASNMLVYGWPSETER